MYISTISILYSYMGISTMLISISILCSYMSMCISTMLISILHSYMSIYFYSILLICLNKSPLLHGIRLGYVLGWVEMGWEKTRGRF